MAGKQDKAAAKAASKEAAKARRAASKAKRSQIFEAFKMQRREDKALVPIMVGVLLLSVAVVFAIGLIFDLQWILLPLVGLLFSNLPALDAQTRLMTGRYLEYRVTEKA